MSTERENLLLAELERPGHRIRMKPEFERRFLDEFTESVFKQRIVLLVLAALMIGATPLYDAWLLGIEPEYKRISNLIQWGIEMPAFIFPIVAALNRRFRHLLEPAIVLGAFIVCGGLLAQRYYGAQYGFSFPHDFTAMVIAAVALLGRVSIRAYIPFVLVVYAATVTVEFIAYGIHGESIFRMISIGMLSTILIVGAYLANSQLRTHWLRKQLLVERSTIDALTGLFNRREFDLVFDRLLSQAARDKESITILLLDIDYFKDYNDYYGHVAGDACLQKVGAVLTERARRPMDIRARLGGEEFVAVWYGSTHPQVEVLAQNLIDGVAELKVKHQKSDVAEVVTVSGGLLFINPSHEHSVTSVLQDADKLLYVAKKAGRNQMITGDNRL